MSRHHKAPAAVPWSITFFIFFVVLLLSYLVYLTRASVTVEPQLDSPSDIQAESINQY